jgi:hypothetical protein
MNYKVLVICPHELPSVILDPIKLYNLSQQPIFFIFALHSTKQYFYAQNILKGKMEGKNGRKGAVD